MRHIAAVAILVAAAGVLAVSSPQAGSVRLNAVVGPGFTISLTDAAGTRVTQLDPGTYEIVVDDRSAEHNFHLRGPGVDRATDVEFVGMQTWTVTIAEGTYTYVCDPHAPSMRGSFIGGDPPPPPPPPKKLTGTVGPGFTIALRNPAGVRVRSLTAGRYAITVRDRGRAHNFHAIGAGINRRTGVAAIVTTTWTVRLTRGTLRWVCDPHRLQMRGSAVVR